MLPLFLPSLARGGGCGRCSDETFILRTSRRTVPFFRRRLLQPNAWQMELERKRRTMRNNSAAHMRNETNPFVRAPIIIIAGNHL